ncbi:hypothetical protein AWR27_10665 [Spirosoma montaniterrae]|uniref:Uncharacterized protein n=1 Tax=Spirosoma montaniterrae TaxID=1178516 RepID=A0A1P9WWH8_9BACT|nr:hypothetical protein AWR27_10665 [Spirosoma montaniterrae]
MPNRILKLPDEGRAAEKDRAVVARPVLEVGIVASVNELAVVLSGSAITNKVGFEEVPLIRALNVRLDGDPTRRAGNVVSNGNLARFPPATTVVEELES